jgi:ribosomal protein S6
LRDDLSRVRQYELMAIFSPEIPEEDLQGAIDRVSAIVGEAGGTVSLINRESPWGRRRLSYPIRHNSRDVRDGYYVLYYADVDTQKVTEIERDLKLTTTLMRYLITQQVAEQMIPESMKPDDESIAGITAPVAEAPAEGAPEGEAAESASEAPAVEVIAAEETAEAPVVEETTAEVPAEETTAEAPVVEETAPAEEAAAEPAAEIADAPATESTEDSAEASGEDTGKES